jgi:hypothetical protein
VQGNQLSVNTTATTPITLDVAYIPADFEELAALHVSDDTLDALVLYAVYRVRDADGDSGHAAAAYNEFLNLAKALQGAANAEGK